MNLIPIAQWRRAVRQRLSSRRTLAFAAGLIGTCIAVLAAGEMYLHHFPPRDLQPYLGEESSLTGPFAPDERLVVRYRSWNDLYLDYAQRFQHYLPLVNAPSRRPVWAFFGNSFVQAPGMLGDTAHAHVPARTVFYLQRNEPLIVRLAQLEMLLEQGIIPERVFVVILPLESYALSVYGLDQYRVNSKGAITYQPRLPPGPLGTLVDRSRLALSAWLRTKFYRNEPSFRFSQTHLPLRGAMKADMERILDLLRDITRPRGVPVTVVLVPNYEQVVQDFPFGLQDQLAEMAQARGLDVCETRSAFLACPAGRRPELFIPDKHFSPIGNRILLDSLMDHLRRIGADPETIDRMGAAR